MFPGYHNGVELQDDELLGIYKFSVPSLWQKQFLVQNWDPIQHSKQEFHELCEWLEIAESILNSPNNYQVKNNNNGLKGKFGWMRGPEQYGRRATTSAPLGKALSFCTTQNNMQKTNLSASSSK
jgi:hypothetical protein